MSKYIAIFKSKNCYIHDIGILIGTKKIKRNRGGSSTRYQYHSTKFINYIYNNHLDENLPLRSCYMNHMDFIKISETLWDLYRNPKTEKMATILIRMQYIKHKAKLTNCQNRRHYVRLLNDLESQARNT